MRPLPRRLAVALAAVLLAATPALAAAAPGDASARGPRGGGGGPGAADGAVDLSGSRQSYGTTNPLVVRNPVCDERLGRDQQENCRVTGTPEGRYPTSNYGFEIHIDTGVDNVVGNFQALLAHIANAIWLALLFVLGLVITLLGWAFELNPFTDNATMGEISAGLERFYRAFTSPWLVVALVIVGGVGLYRGLVKREVAATVGGTLLTVALMIGALVVIHAPRETVGKVSELSNQAAQSVIAAPQRGSLSNPTSSYAEATDEVWRDMTIPGFAALNFSNVDWALSEPDPVLLAKSNETACQDYAYLSSLDRRQLRRIFAVNGGQLDCSEIAPIAPRPRTNAEIWLRNSPGSEARDSLWDEFTDDPPYNTYFAIQGDGGAWTRLPLVLLIGLGLLGGIALFSWLALRIFVQTAVAFVLVLTTPVALFLPAFGESGRRAFGFWATTLLGALVSKLIYAALLSVVLFATTVVGSLIRGGGGVGAMMSFLVMAGLWWAVFLKREELVAWISVSRDDSEGGSGALGRLTGLYAATRMGGAILRPLGAGAGGAARGAAGAAAGGFLGSRHDRAEGTRRVAEGELERRARERLAGRRRDAENLISEQAGRRARLAALTAERAEAVEAAGRHRAAGSDAPDRWARGRHQDASRDADQRGERLAAEHGELSARIAADEAREAGARAFLARAEERRAASGSEWSAGNLANAREAIRRDANQPVSSGVHAWRVEMTPERYERLEGRERETAHRKVADALRQDRTAFGAIPDRPEGAVKRAGQRAYRGAVRREHGTAGHRQLQAAGRAARRERRRVDGGRARRLPPPGGASR
jgi:hypothetical protein